MQNGFMLLWLAIAAIATGCGDQLRDVKPQGSLALQGECLDFGVVPPGSTAELPLVVGNDGQGRLELQNFAAAAGPFVPVGGLPVPFLEPGEEATLMVRFAPVRPGNVTGGVRLRTSDPEKREREVCARGIGGGPKVVCEPERVDFLGVPLGMSREARIVCTNAGAGEPYGTLHVTDLLRLDGDLSARIVDDDGTAGPRDEGYPPGASFTIEVTFSPELVGERGGVLELHSNDPVRPVLALVVTGDGVDTAPCELELPASVDFGEVDVGRRVIKEVELRNVGESVCTIWDLALAEGASPAFAVSTLDRAVVQPGESVDLVVAFEPTSRVPRHEAEIVMVISDPASPDRSIRVTGSSQAPCLVFVPDAISFGEVAPSCGTSSHEVRLVNECDEATTVEELRAPSRPFGVVQLPEAPFDLRARESLSLQVSMRPETLGFASSRLLARAHGGETQVEADLSGSVVEEPVLRDVFTQRNQHRIDLLWVIDNSASMQQYQSVLAQGLQSFLTYALDEGIDFQVGVTTTGLTPAENAALCPGGVAGGEDGRLFPVDGSSPRILRRTTANLANHWATNVSVGICNGVEQGLEAAFRALTPPLIDSEDDLRHDEPNDGNAGLLRDGAHLAVVFLTDEEDQSGLPVRDYFDALAAVRGASRPDLLSIHAIAGDRGAGCSGRRGLARPGDRYAELVARGGGVFESVCQDDWTAPLQRIGAAAFGLQVRFPLSNACRDGDHDGQITDGEVEVKVDGEVVPSTDGQGERAWSYDRETNAIEFFWPHVPAAGSEIEVSCTPGCGP